jgi:pimeloyl-ACP methyl ester carboxylesterase
VENQFYQDLTQNLTREEAQHHHTQAMQACHARLIKEGRNLAAYTSAANAADVNDLRAALGYTEWNLYGVSYGTRLALTVMRDYPHGVRSAILDSADPPQVEVEAEMAGNAERALHLLFERCAADATCNAAYPELKTAFYETVAQLDTTPITLTLTRSKTGQTYEAVVNGDRLIVDVFQLLYFTEALPHVPALIYELHEARGAYMLRQFLNEMAFLNDYLSEGMSASVQCDEEVNFTSPQAVATASATMFSRLRDAIHQQFVFPDLATCAEWRTKPAAIENQPVASDIPTLILAGDNDPITPPAWGQLAAQTLSQSHFFEFRWVGHGVLGAGVWGSCSQSMVSAFLADPHSAPDSTCLSKLKVFFVTK